MGSLLASCMVDVVAVAVPEAEDEEFGSRVVVSSMASVSASSGCEWAWEGSGCVSGRVWDVVSASGDVWVDDGCWDMVKGRSPNMYSLARG